MIVLVMCFSHSAQHAFQGGGAFSSYAIADGNLITGQQNSGAAAAELVVEMLAGDMG